MKYIYFKCAFDFLLALLLLVLFSPLFVLIGLCVFIQTKSAVFFSQPRGGYKGKVFNIYKFKTMRDIYLANGQPAPDAQRVTKLGLFLRKTSLDELPSLLNILKGEMSFVGPRPFMAEYLPLYSPEQFRRHSVRPGLTGWAQVNGRNAVSWEEKFDLDLWYIDHRSLSLDFKIMLLTFKKIFHHSEVQAADHISMPKFTGTNAQNPSKNQEDK